MQLANLMGGKTPYITNLTVYSASAINQGAFVVVSDGTAITNMGFTVSTNTGSANCTDFCGCTTLATSVASLAQENLGLGGQSFNMPSTGIPNRSIGTAGQAYIPVLLSPGAVYFGRYDQTTGAATAGVNVHSFTASNTTNVVYTICGLTSNAGAWAYSVATVSTGTATFSGQLRQIANSAASTSFTMVSAWQVSTDSEAVVTYSPAALGCSFSLNGTADIFGTIARSAAAGSAARNDGAQMKVIATSIKHDAAPFHRLTQRVDDGLDGVTNGQLYSEVVFLDNYWNNAA